MSASLEHIEELLTSIEAIANELRYKEPIGGGQITVTGLDDLSENLGLIKAGEFRSGTGVPGKGTGFTGIRLGAPGWTYSSTQYSIVGLNADVLQFGMSNTDGKVYAGAGKIVIDANGLNVIGAENTNINFQHTDSGTAVACGKLYAGWDGTPTGNNVLYLTSFSTSGTPWGDSYVQIQASDSSPDPDTVSMIQLASTGVINVTATSVFFSGNVDYTGNLQAYRNSAYTIGYIFVPSHPPFTHADWTADAKAADADGTIDLSTFSDGTNNFPAGVKAVAVRLAVKDETPNVLVQLGPDSGHLGAVSARTQVANQTENVSGIVPCDSNGDIYIDFGDEVDECTVQIWGYFL